MVRIGTYRKRTGRRGKVTILKWKGHDVTGEQWSGPERTRNTMERNGLIFYRTATESRAEHTKAAARSGKELYESKIIQIGRRF